MRRPFQKHIPDIRVEEAHGGSGKRQLLLSSTDPVSPHFQAMTKGYLSPGAVFDWHHHDAVDEFFLVLAGTGLIEYDDGTSMVYSPSDLIYIPANTSHRITATGDVENEFYFCRVNA